MLRLFLISIDLLISLPLVMLFIVLLVSLTYVINLNSSYTSFFSHELYVYARSQINEEFGIRASNIMPLNASCNECRIITYNQKMYKMVIN